MTTTATPLTYSPPAGARCHLGGCTRDATAAVSVDGHTHTHCRTCLSACPVYRELQARTADADGTISPGSRSWAS